jgi:hypothetical protein
MSYVMLDDARWQMFPRRRREPNHERGVVGPCMDREGVRYSLPDSTRLRTSILGSRGGELGNMEDVAWGRRALGGKI